VSAAIAADIVPMTGENRVLAYFGLQVINSNKARIKAIIHQIKESFRYYRCCFIIAPRINAAGRKTAIMRWNC
jgi:single-stranded-DNA-specific exonuclease